MENRYYTPDLEEFHPGFPYEYRTTRSLLFFDNSNGEWKYERFDARSNQEGGTEISDIEYLIEGKNIRVKHLDQKDIESLGWEKIREDTFEMKLPEYRGMLDVLVHLVLRETLLICVGDSETPYSDWRTLFTGTVKNKSELKKVMKMIGI